MARLILKFGAKVERVLELDAPEIVIGRGSEAHLEIDEEVVSRRHCRVVKKGDGHVVEDLGSRVGTLVNGQRWKSHLLENGDSIGFGRYAIVYEAGPTKPVTGIGTRAPGGASTAAEAEAGAFWADAAADSGITASVPEMEPVADRSGGASVESAAELKAATHKRGDIDDYKQTMLASAEEIERVRKSLMAQQKPHLAVVQKGKRKVVNLEGDRFTAGWEEGHDFRFPGSRWFGKTAFTLHKAGQGYELHPASFWTAVTVNGRRAKGALPLDDGATIEAGGVKFKYGKGEL